MYRSQPGICGSVRRKTMDRKQIRGLLLGAVLGCLCWILLLALLLLLNN